MKTARRVLIAAIALPFLTWSGAPLADSGMLELATRSGCFICHRVSPDPKQASPLAPSYQEIAARYRQDAEAFDRLVDRVLHGTAYKEQAWAGRVSMRFMPPNVNVSRQDAMALVHWALELEPEPGLMEALRAEEQALVLAATAGCMACHGIDPVAVARVMPLAPAFREIAAFYDGKPDAAAKLEDAVLNGTLNRPKVWEHVNMRFMPPSVALRKEDARRLVQWILGLEHEGVRVPMKPERGTRAEAG